LGAIGGGVSNFAKIIAGKTEKASLGKFDFETGLPELTLNKLKQKDVEKEQFQID
jgi:hypothetical protein